MNSQTVLDFVTRDARAGRVLAGWRFGIAALSLTLPVLLAALAGFRAGQADLLAGSALATLTILLALQATVPFLIARTMTYSKTVRTLLTAGLAIAAASVFFRLAPIGTTDVVSPQSETWRAHLACLGFGVIVSLVTFASEWMVMHLFGPVPDLATRVFMALAASLAGLLALDLHCGSLDALHLAAAHLGHGFIIAPVALFLLNREAARRLTAVVARSQDSSPS